MKKVAYSFSVEIIDYIIILTLFLQKILLKCKKLFRYDVNRMGIYLAVRINTKHAPVTYEKYIF